MAKPKPEEPDDGKIRLTPEQIRKANAERLQRNLMIHLGYIPGLPLRAFEVKELYDSGLLERVLGAEVLDSMDEVMGGLEGVAAYIQAKFTGIQCNKMDISNWRRNKHLPECCAENFPPSHNSGRTKKALIDGWVAKYLKVGAGVSTDSDNTDYDRKRKKFDALKAQKEYELLEKETSGLYTLTETAKRTGSAVAIVARNTCREAMEKKLLKRFGSLLTQTVTAAPQTPEGIAAAVLEKLRTDSAETYAEWQAQAQRQLVEMLDNLKPETKTQ